MTWHAVFATVENIAVICGVLSTGLFILVTFWPRAAVARWVEITTEQRFQNSRQFAVRLLLFWVGLLALSRLLGAPLDHRGPVTVWVLFGTVVLVLAGLFQPIRERNANRRPVRPRTDEQ